MSNESKAFLGLPRLAAADLRPGSVAILGVSEASPYKPDSASHSADAPRVLREASQSIAKSLSQFDFDLGMALLPDAGDYRGMADLGDVPTDPADAEGNRARIRAGVRDILTAGAVPIILGGDDSVPIPVIDAFEGHGPLTILQIDAHVDWADVIGGNAYGYGSPMRRAAEMDWVTGMVQVGIRGLGSGQSWQHDDARSWGSKLITSYQLHRDGLASVLDQIAQGANIFVSIDCDGLDPAMFPAVNMPTPGGLHYEETIELLTGAARKGRIAGMGLFEYVPDRDDPHRLSAQIGVRLVMTAMAMALEDR